MERAGQNPVELHLKDMDARQLCGTLFNFGEHWTPAEQRMVARAIDLAAELHAENSYRGQQYLMHQLRVANRLAGYLEMRDPELVCAAILHDTPEDHSKGIIDHYKPGLDMQQITPKEQQIMGLDYLARNFTPRVGLYVSYVTNPPDMGAGLDHDGWLQAYANKVRSAVVPVHGWLLKFPDWSDNALGLRFSEQEITPERVYGWEVKYGLVQPILEDRYRQPDLQELLSPQAHTYVQHQFELGRERLVIPE